MQIRDKQNETLIKLAKAIGSITAAKFITKVDLRVGVLGSGNVPKFLEEAEQRLREVQKEFRAYLAIPDYGVEEDIANESELDTLIGNLDELLRKRRDGKAWVKNTTQMINDTPEDA